MKQPTICTLLFAFVSVGAALAQTPDTTSAERYFPLEVGNVWEYENYRDSCGFEGGCDNPTLAGYSRWTVMSEDVIEGTRYVELWDERFSRSGVLEPDGRDVRILRFDAVDARPKWLVDDEEAQWLLTCRLDAPFGANLGSECGFRTAGGYERDVVISEDTLTTTLKEFFAGPSSDSYTFAADVGMTAYSSFFFGDPTFYFEWALTYARIGGQEYGSRRFPPAVDTESAPNAPALALSVYPNPVSGDATVQLSLDAPQRVTLAVYDVLGRRVLSDDLGARPAGEVQHGLDTARLPAGVYLVRLTGDAGATATARLVRQ